MGTYIREHTEDNEQYFWLSIQAFGGSPWRILKMDLKFIYAGYSKCGTKTMAKAFRILGYRVFDFEETLFYGMDILEKFYSPNYTKSDKIQMLRELFQEFDIVMDNPWYVFWEELLEAFPEAKCIFYERPVDEWLNSILRQKNAIVNSRSDSDFKKSIFL